MQERMEQPRQQYGGNNNIQGHLGLTATNMPAHRQTSQKLEILLDDNITRLIVGNYKKGLGQKYEEEEDFNRK